MARESIRTENKRLKETWTADFLAAWTRTSGITQKRLADLLRSDTKTVNRWFRGRSGIGNDNLRKLEQLRQLTEKGHSLK